MNTYEILMWTHGDDGFGRDCPFTVRAKSIEDAKKWAFETIPWMRVISVKQISQGEIEEQHTEGHRSDTKS